MVFLPDLKTRRSAFFTKVTKNFEIRFFYPEDVDLGPPKLHMIESFSQPTSHKTLVILAFIGAELPGGQILPPPPSRARNSGPHSRARVNRVMFSNCILGCGSNLEKTDYKYIWIDSIKSKPWHDSIKSINQLNIHVDLFRFFSFRRPFLENVRFVELFLRNVWFRRTFLGYFELIQLIQSYQSLKVNWLSHLLYENKLTQSPINSLGKGTESFQSISRKKWIDSNQSTQ